MRLIERSMKEIRIAPRVKKRGELGERAEAFSGETALFRGSVLPGGGELSAREKGLRGGERLLLLLPADAQAQVGDGAWVDGKLYLIRAVRRWTAHLELECEARG